jgi:hypothetical protein
MTSQKNALTAGSRKRLSSDLFIDEPKSIRRIPADGGCDVS